MLALAFSLFAFSALAHALSRRLDPRGSAALTIALLFTLLIVSVEALGALELFSQNNVLLLGGLALGGAFLLRNPHEKPVHSSAWFLLLTLGLLATLPSFLPSGETDTLGYHLPIVSALLSTGSVWQVPFTGFVGPNTYFPANHEALQAFLALFTHNLEAGFLVNLSGLALFFFSLKESLGEKKRNLAPLLFLLVAATTPFLFKQVSNEQIDLFLFSLFGSALSFLSSSFVHYKKEDFTKACLLLGLCLGSKYNALPQVLVLLPFLLALAVHQKHRLKDYALNLGLTLAAGLFWYLRNALLTGNPLYPFGLSALNWIGHSTFVQETKGTDLLSHLQREGLASSWDSVLSNTEFHNELAVTGLALLGLVALLLALRTLLTRSKTQRLLGLCLLLIATGELLYYLSAPYTFTLWNQTIRYASPLYALVPVALMVLASTHKRRTFLTLLCLPLIGLQLGNGFLSREHVQAFFTSIPTALLFVPLLTALALAIASSFKGRLLRLALFSLILSVFATGLVPQFKTPTGTASSAAEDAYLSVDLPGYEALLPFLEVLRGEEKGELALAGLTPYALFEKEGFTPLYVSIDGCTACTYPDYRRKAQSIRTNPDEAAWKAALTEQGIDYLLVSTSYEPELPLFEKSWADADPAHFELLKEEGELSLYRLR